MSESDDKLVTALSGLSDKHVGEFFTLLANGRWPLLDAERSMHSAEIRYKPTPLSTLIRLNRPAGW